MLALNQKYGTSHFICDEVPSSIMTFDVSNNIRIYMQTALKESYVVIIQQSITKNREYQKRFIEFDYFGALRCEVHKLKAYMRMSVGNHKLVDTAQKVIKIRKLQVALPTEEKNRNETTSSSTQKHAEAVPRYTVEETSSATEQQSEAAQHTIEQTTSSGRKQHHQQQVVFQDLDISLKLIEISKVVPKSHNIVTTSINFVDGKMGHNIVSKKPKLIFLPETDDGDCLNTLSLIVKKYFMHSPTPVFVANSMKSAKMLTYAAQACNKETMIYIPYLQRRNPELNEKQAVINNFLSSSSDASLLVIDSKSFLGMEHEAVVTIVDPMERLMRYSIVETASRCTSSLSMFVLSNHARQKEGSLGEILDAWIAEDLVEVIHVTLENGDTVMEPISICENTSHIIVYRKSEKFVSLFKRMQSFKNECFRIFLEDEDTR